MKRFLAVMVLLTLLLTGCGPSGDPAQTPAAPELSGDETPQDPPRNEPPADEPEQEPEQPQTPEQPADPGLTTELLRQQLKEAGKTLAVAYLGHLSYGTGPALSFLENRAFPLTEELPFLTEIPAQNVVCTGEQGEVYAVVFADPEMHLQILARTGTGGADPDFDRVVYDGTAAQPLLLVCNAALRSDMLLCSEAFLWQPRLDDCLFVAGDGLLDVSPYDRLLLEDYGNILQRSDGGWVVPTAEDLQDTGWYEKEFTGRGYLLWQTELDARYMDIRWNTGLGEADREAAQIQWELDEKDGIAVLTVDLGNTLGVRTYIVLLNREDGTLYIARDATRGELTPNGERLYRVLLQLRKTPTPADMTGSWTRAYTDGPDGRLTSLPGACVVSVHGSEETGWRFSYADRNKPEWTVEDCGILILSGSDSADRTEVRWTGLVNTVGPDNLVRTVMLSDSGELVIQSTWIVGGETQILHEFFRRS